LKVPFENLVVDNDDAGNDDDNGGERKLKAEEVLISVGCIVDVDTDVDDVALVEYSFVKYT